MKTIKIIITLTFIFAVSSFAQTGEPKKIYFLVDTAKNGNSHQLVQIERNTVFNRTYHFFCRSFPYYEMDLQFSYDDHKKAPKTKVLDSKPNIEYTSWKKLHSLLEDKQKFFENYYELNIVEALPNGKFMVNPVKRDRYMPPTQDGIILKPEGKQKN